MNLLLYMDQLENLDHFYNEILLIDNDLHNYGDNLSCQECDEDVFEGSYTNVNIDNAPDHLKHHKFCLFPSQVVCIEMMKRYKGACVTTCA